MPAWPSTPPRFFERSVTPPRPETDPRVRWLAWTDAGPFRLWHKAYRSDFTQTRHAHPTGSIDFNIAGHGTGQYLGRERPSLAGGVEFYRTDGEHTFLAGPRGIRVLHVIFADAQVAPPGPRDACHEDPFDPDEGAAAGLAARILRELQVPANRGAHASSGSYHPDEPHAGDASTALTLESLAHELLAATRRWPRLPDPGRHAIARAADYLRAAPAEPVSLSALADEVALHPSHLARAFRRAMGVTPGEYHRRARVALAAKRLATGDKPIAGVAGDLGFADQAHLTRWFTRLAGISPAAYRRAIRG